MYMPVLKFIDILVFEIFDLEMQIQCPRCQATILCCTRWGVFLMLAIAAVVAPAACHSGWQWPVDGKWAKAQRRRTSKTQLSNQRNFLLVCVADSILLLHTPIPVIQGRVRPAGERKLVCLFVQSFACICLKKIENVKSSYDFGKSISSPRF